MAPIRIGCVKYLNTLPLIEGLELWRDAQVIQAVPSKLIGMLRAGEVDVALASIIDCARSAQAVGGLPVEDSPVTLIPVGMIGCDGPTLTVRLYSRGPIDQMSSLAVDTDSHTSRALAQVILLRSYQRRVEVTDFSRGSTSWPDGLVLIGDKVVTDAPPGEIYPHQLDLGEAWKQLTGMPFVYAAWMCRAGEEHRPEVQAAAAVLDRQRRHNAGRLDWIISSRAQQKHWPEALARRYVGDYLKYDLGKAERRAVEQFLEWSAELGLCGRVRVRWMDKLEPAPK